MKAVQNERHQAEDVEMNRPRSVPSARENEKPDEEIQQRGDSQVILNRGGVVLRCGYERDFKRLAVATDFVVNFRPRARAEQQLGDVGGATDFGSVDRFNEIALLDSSAVRRSAGSHVPGRYPIDCIHPGDAIIGDDEARALLEVYNGEHHRRQRDQRQDGCP